MRITVEIPDKDITEAVNEFNGTRSRGESKLKVSTVRAWLNNTEHQDVLAGACLDVAMESAAP